MPIRRRWARAEGQGDPGGGGQSGAHRGERRGDDVLLDRRVGLGRQAVALGRLGQQEERAEAAGQLLARRVAGAVEIGAVQPAIVQRRDAPLRDVDQLVVGAELDRVGRARLRARRLQSVLEAVVAERALGGAAVVG